MTAATRELAEARAALSATMARIGAKLERASELLSDRADMHRIAAHVSPDLERRIAGHACRRRVSQSQAIRELIEKGLEASQ